MDDLKFRDNRWECPQCHVHNEIRVSKCAFCSTERPSGEDLNKNAKEKLQKEHTNMMKMLYRLINPLHIKQKRAILNFIENNM